MQPYMELARGRNMWRKEGDDVPTDVEVVIWTLVEHGDVHTWDTSCCGRENKCKKEEDNNLTIDCEKAGTMPRKSATRGAERFSANFSLRQPRG